MSIDRRYWDSDCFLAWLQSEAGKADGCREVLEAADEGKILLITSALTLAEVLYLRGGRPIPKARKDAVVDFFKNEYIAVRNVTRHIAEMARELVWDHGIRPKDAIHVATALEARLAVMNTFDENLLRKSPLVGSPQLIIAKPSVREPKLPFVGTQRP
jgi:predicted nucleic acid-binding protein